MHGVAPQCAVKVAVDGEAGGRSPGFILLIFFAGPWRRDVVSHYAVAWFVTRGSRLQNGWL